MTLPEGERGSDKIKKLYIVLGFLLFLLFCSSCLISFFIGRESVKWKLAGESAKLAQTAAFHPSSEVAGRFGETNAVSEPRSSSSVVENGDTYGYLPESSEKEPITSIDEKTKVAVKQYFFELDTIMQAGRIWENPEMFANRALQGVMSGDPSSFDELVSSMKEVQKKLSALKAPEPCVRHKANTITVVSNSISMLETIRNAISSGEISPLADLPNQAENLKASAGETDALAKSIKSRYGIKP